jgi:transposase
MNAIFEVHPIVRPTVSSIAEQTAMPTPFSQEMVLITKQELIALRHQEAFWKAQHARAKHKIDELEAELLRKDAIIKDLQNRLFGKKGEKGKSRGSESDTNVSSGKSRGQAKGNPGHGRTPRPDLTVVDVTVDLSEDQKKCPHCGLPHHRREALDETSDVIEVLVNAHVRRYHRPAYVPSEGCCCPESPAIIIAPPPVRLLQNSPFGVSFWVEIMLRKFHYAQSTHRLLQDFRDQGLPVSPGTVAGGLQKIAPYFTPIMEALYCKQMSEELFFNDETRWAVFVEIDGKIGTRWYLWVTRSRSVIYYDIDPSRSAAVPGAHFAGLQKDRVIIVCDRYSAYKKLARLSDGILLAFCWAHVRRDFLDAGRSMTELEPWALEWKERIATLYHLNALRLEHWQPEVLLEQQSAEFLSRQQELQKSLQSVHDEAIQLAKPKAHRAGNELVTKNTKESLSQQVAREEQRKIAQSLLNHWPGLSLFLTHPEVPMDNNLAENAIRNPAMGRKNYYGSGSIWSAELAATLFSIFQTLALWGIPQRSWLTTYLQACAENGGQAPSNIDAFLPWSMVDAPITKRPKTPPARPPPMAVQEAV